MSRTTYISCEQCDFKVVEKYVGCEHQQEKSGFTRSAAPIAKVFIGPDGQVSVPGQADARMPERLRKLGYTERVIQDSAQYSTFCKDMDREAVAKHEQAFEARQRYFEAKSKQERSDLRAQLRTQFGRDFLEEAIRQGDSGYGERYQPGSHLEGFEYNAERGRE